MAPQKTISAAAWAGIAFMGVCWGGSFVATKLMLAEMAVETQVSLRVFGGAFVLWAFVLIKRYPLPRTAAPWIAFLLIGFINVALPYFFISWGQQHISSGLAGILNATTAIFGPLVAAIAFADERLGMRKAVGVILGFLGVSTVIGLESLRSFDLTSAGQLSLIAASACYAIGAAATRVYLTNMRLEVSAAGMMGAAALWLVPVALVKHGLPDVASYSGTALFAWGYVAVISTALAYLVLFRVIKSAGSGNATLVTLIVAPVSVILGALILDERLALSAYIGFGLIACGLLVIDGRIVQRLRR